MTPAIEYKINKNWVGELLLAQFFEHDVRLSGGGLTNSNAASFEHLPPTLSLKYLFSPDATFSPYVGLGINYTFVFDEETRGALEGADLSGDDSVGIAANVGFEYAISKKWGLAVDLRYIDIDSDLRLNGEKIGELNVDPFVIGISAAYHF